MLIIDSLYHPGFESHQGLCCYLGYITRTSGSSMISVIQVEHINVSAFVSKASPANSRLAIERSAASR